MYISDHALKVVYLHLCVTTAAARKEAEGRLTNFVVQQ